MQEIIFQSNKCDVWKTTVLMQEMCRYWIGMFWCFRFGGMGKDKPKLNNPESSGSLVTRYVLHPLHSPLYWSLIVQFNYVIFSVSRATLLQVQAVKISCEKRAYMEPRTWAIKAWVERATDHTTNALLLDVFNMVLYTESGSRGLQATATSPLCSEGKRLQYLAISGPTSMYELSSIF